MNRILLIILVSFLPVGFVLAQQPLVVAPTVGVSNTGTAKLYYGKKNEPARAIEFRDRQVTASEFTANINRYFDIPLEFTFLEKESNTDELGMHHRLLQQYYKGIPLDGMGYRIHEKGGFVISANGRSVRNIKTDVQANISEQQAFELAKKYLNTKDTTIRHGKKLLVSKGFTFAPESFSIAFQFDIDVSLVEQWRISIDARNGQVINKVSLVNTCGNDDPPLANDRGTGMSTYYGTRDILVDKYNDGSSRMAGQSTYGANIGTYDFRGNLVIVFLFFDWVDVYDFYSSTNTYNDPYQSPAVSVQWGAEQVYNYYLRKHNRNSFDNNGSAIKSYVHVDYKMDNAFWARNQLLFGDGSRNNPLVELDVVAHELTHGVTQFEAGLQYFNEPGALNESFSDILGKAVEFDVFGDTATWLVGKHFRNGGLRDLSNPNLQQQADTYLGDLWHTGYEDNGGVHYNSGVQNFWFYLLSKGGSGVNDHQLAYSVNAVGVDVAAKIAYRNLTEYLTNYSDYLDSRIGSMLATADLYGNNSNIYQEVDKAWDAVGVIDEPIITSLEVYDITGTTAKIKGSLVPRGNNVTYHFEYGTTPAYGNSTPTYQYTDKVEGILTGLQSQTKYYARLVAVNENGPSYFATEFTTISLAPLVKIEQTVDVTETTAVLHGQVNPNSLSTSFHFEYGLTPALGSATASYPLQGLTEYQNVSVPILGLEPRQTYYYKLVATNSFSTSVSESASFFTAMKPVITSFSPITAPIDTEVTITGTNFNTQSGKDLVNFGATRATVLSASSTEIKVKVPAGASFGTITLLDSESGLAAESIQEFVPTFSGEFKKNSLQLRVGSTDYIQNSMVRDMDGDNRPDIVTHQYLGFSVWLNANQGGDITEESFIKSTFNSDDSPSELALADFDGNGLMDVVALYSNKLRIFPNLSVPGYIFFGAPVDIPVSNSFSHATLKDFDGDGHVDIAVTTYINDYNSEFTLIRNENSRGSLSTENFRQRYKKTLSYYPQFITTGDLNNDGAVDLSIGSYNRNTLSILKNMSAVGNFDFEETTVEDLTRNEYVRYVSADLNQDGWKDIISHSPYLQGKMALMLNKQNSDNITLEPSGVMLNEYVQSAVQPGDINGDGKVDLIAATDQRQFIYLENKLVGDDLSFEKSGPFGTAIPESAHVTAHVSINDLNGDGRPEVINAYSYSYAPHDGYQLEIWQNTPYDCIDPSTIKINVSHYTAQVVLPPNTSFEDFQMDYTLLDGSPFMHWTPINSPTFHLGSGFLYRLRVRAKCYLGFTDYQYIDFNLDCVDLSDFYISDVSVNTANVNSIYLYNFEVQYSPAGSDQWEILPQNDSQLFNHSSQLTNLMPGTTYDVRFRGRCNASGAFKHMQFTTLCPNLSNINVTDIRYNSAFVNWSSNYSGAVILEYSADNLNWDPVAENRILSSLQPGHQYFLRGKFDCRDVSSDFIFASFTTDCPEASQLRVENITPFGATFSWADESLTNSYTVTYSIAGDNNATTVETTSTFLILEGLNPGTNYSVSVAPNCVTKHFTFTSFNTVCYSPFDLSVDVISHTTAGISWNDNFTGLPYLVDYSIAGSNDWQTIETSSMNVSLADLRPGTSYEVRVHIECSKETATFASVVFETDYYEETTFAPNPTPDKVLIRPSKNLIGKHFTIMDNAGRVLYEGELRDYSIDLTNFSVGIHILKIDGEKPVKIFKY